MYLDYSRWYLERTLPPCSPNNRESSKHSDHANRMRNQTQVTESNTIMGALPPQEFAGVVARSALSCHKVIPKQNSTCPPNLFQLSGCWRFNSRSEGSYYRIFPRFYWRCTLHEALHANIFINRSLLSSEYVLSNTLHDRISE